MQSQYYGSITCYYLAPAACIPKYIIPALFTKVVMILVHFTLYLFYCRSRIII